MSEHLYDRADGRRPDEPARSAGCDGRESENLHHDCGQTGSAQTGNAPRSGVPGLKPGEVRKRLLENGWSVLPIQAHDRGPLKPRGKRPVVAGWQRFAEFSGPRPSLDELSTWAQMNHAPGTGIACGSVIAIDIDFAKDTETGAKILGTAIEVFGPTPFIRQGRAPKVALIYRASEAVGKRHLKRSDGSDDGIDILGEGSQLVAYGIHRDTGQPNRWIGDEEPLTASPLAAPEISGKQIDAFLEKVRLFCDLTSSSARDKKERRGEGERIERDATGRVTNGRERYLTDLIYRVACEMFATDPNVAARKSELVEKAWTRFEETARTDDGKWSIRDVEIKVDALLARVANGNVRLTATADDHLIAEMNETYCVVREGGKTRVLSFQRGEGRAIPVYQSCDDFRNFTMHKKVWVNGRQQGVGQFWLNHPDRRTYDGVVFKPNGEPEVNGCLNLWQGFAIEPRQGDWSLMKAHVREVLASGDREHGTYILRWLAWAVQNPDKVPEVALVFKGAEGTGKGFLGRAMTTIFGQHGLQVSDVRHLAGNFNAHLRDTCLLFADEALWPGDPQAEAALKRLLTEDTLFIEPKGVNGFKCPNFLHVIMASNEEWVVPAGPDARRFAVFEVSSERKQDTAYFQALDEERKNGGLEAMLYDLLNLDLKGWHPRKLVKTDALRDQQLSSLDYPNAWWLSILEEGALPGADLGALNVAPMRDLLEDFKTKHPRAGYITEHRLGRFLRSRGAEPGKWVNDRRGWRFPTLADARAAWERSMPARWEDPDLTEWRPFRI